MKVVLLGPWPPPHGGVETNVVAIRQYIRKQGVLCDVVNITRFRKPEGDGIFYPDGAIALIRHLLTRRYDVIHLHVGGLLPSRVIRLALLCSALPWAKSVFTFHSGGYPHTDEGKAMKAESLAGFTFRRFDRIVTVNDELVSFFASLNVPRSRIRLIPPHSVALTEPALSLSTELAQFRKNHDPVLIAICGLEPEYDIPRPIAAMKRILERHPKAGLIIAGSGSQLEQIQAAISATNYSNAILLAGDVPHEMTLRALIESDISLRTTVYDGDAISVREALYWGTPVIATKTVLRPEGVRLIPIGDTVALEDAILAQLAEGKPVPRERVEDTENVQKILDLYRELTQ